MAEEGVKRKLTAILSADAKAYSRLMGEDEVGTVQLLKEYREIMESALMLAQRAVATDETFGWSHLALGSAYLNKREHDKAIATLEKGILIQPGPADAYRYLGFSLAWAGRGDEAIDAVKKSIRLDPGYERPILGICYFTAGRYEDAIATINQKYADYARKGHLILCFLAAS